MAFVILHAFFVEALLNFQCFLTIGENLRKCKLRQNESFIDKSMSKLRKRRFSLLAKVLKRMTSDRPNMPAMVAQLKINAGHLGQFTKIKKMSITTRTLTIKF